jgi:hypothetical protein
MDVVSHNAEVFDRKSILFLTSPDNITEESDDGIIIKNDFIPINFADDMVRCTLSELSVSVLHTLCMASLLILLRFFS